MVGGPGRPIGRPWTMQRITTGDHRLGRGGGGVHPVVIVVAVFSEATPLPYPTPGVWCWGPRGVGVVDLWCGLGPGTLV